MGTTERRQKGFWRKKGPAAFSHRRRFPSRVCSGRNKDDRTGGAPTFPFCCRFPVAWYMCFAYNSKGINLTILLSSFSLLF
jgi:hypothetical protein